MGDEAGGPPDDPVANGGMAQDGADAPFTPHDFEEELSTLVRRAASNGIDVVGGWTVEEGTGRRTPWASRNSPYAGSREADGGGPGRSLGGIE